MPPADRLSEVQVVESFHLLLRESFRRAQAEGLLSEAEISAAGKSPLLHRRDHGRPDAPAL